ncbi:MAG: SMP-30/gluconolactonase/LRE family protein [Anaerolineaceae bacterium]
MDLTPTILLDGLKFPEGPRWHEGRLWFSDMHAHRVMTVEESGQTSIICEVPNRPSGLGFTPDGRLLVVSMTDRKLLCLNGNLGLKEVSDISLLASGDANDMVVDDQARSYIGNFGFDYSNDEKFKPASLVMVRPDGVAQVVADELLFPNGSVITADGGRLIVAETYGRRLTAFDINKEDGTLSNRRIWAEVDPATPDGICLDDDGAIWVASPVTEEFIRVLEGGIITDRIKLPPGKGAYACTLGGADGRTLFLCTSEGSQEDRVAGRSRGWIETVRVDVPGAGRP